MERMTVKRKDGRWALADNDGETPVEQVFKLPQAISRLAAFEDTGLEPEEVVALQASFQELNSEAAPLMQAKIEGRLVVLPEVPEADRKLFADNLHDVFTEWVDYDTSVGIFGMSEGERALAIAFMKVLGSDETALTETEETK